MDYFGIVYFSIAVLSLLCSVIYTAWRKEAIDDPVDIIGPMIILAFSWPFVLMVVVLVGPFYFLYRMVSYLRDKYDQNQGQ